MCVLIKIVIKFCIVCTLNAPCHPHQKSAKGSISCKDIELFAK